MREISFRAWDGKEMYDNFRPLWSDNSGITYPANNGGLIEYDDSLDSEECDLKVMQFTGLMDKNETKIYEGDIIKVYNDRYDEDDKHFLEETITTVKWGDRGYLEIQLPKTKGWVPLHWYQKRKHEVIGNIWENPELLEEKE